uniref:Aprataxin n=1 Tax=Romanomermis culicivorax TaxID=13658 RepID=A0A915IJX4_ROMCU
MMLIGLSKSNLMKHDRQYDIFQARNHFLVVSKKDIDSIDECSRNDLQLLQHMEVVGLDISKKYGTDDQNFRYGFHARPSLSRLHLHVISQDFDSPCLKNKKHWNSFNTEFFRLSSDVIREIDKEGEVKKFNKLEIERFLKSDLKSVPKMFRDVQNDSQVENTSEYVHWFVKLLPSRYFNKRHGRSKLEVFDKKHYGARSVFNCMGS